MIACVVIALISVGSIIAKHFAGEFGEQFFSLLSITTFVVTPILFVAFLVRAFKKKPKKQIGIAALVCFVGFFVFVSTESSVKKANMTPEERAAYDLSIEHDASERQLSREAEQAAKEAKRNKESDAKAAAKPITTEAPPTTMDSPTVKQPTKTTKKVEIITSSLETQKYDDKQYLVVTYSYTNTGSVAQSFNSECSPIVFQNGIECPRVIFWDFEGYEGGRGSNDIKPGVTYEVYEAYELQNASDDVTVEVKSFWGVTTYATKVFKFDQ